jgi:NhaC family Na+:H+ antiporter
MTSLITGTSWGTAGTIGVAFMGIAAGLGIPAPIAAGAVISGAYFGDKISPLSDTTNMTSSVAGSELFAHIKCMFKQTAIAYIFAVAAFLIIGFTITPTAAGETADYIRQGLEANFNISPMLFIPPVAVIIAIGLKIPALPGIFIGLLAGGIFAILFQGASFADIMSVGREGFSIDTGYADLDILLSRGGIAGKMYAISLILIAMAFGGVMEKSRQLEVVVDKIIKWFVRGTTSLITATVGTTFVSNAAMADQYVAVILPTKMFAASYRNRGYHPKMLSSAVDGTGTLTSALIPWNTCGIYMAGILGVTTWQYAPFAFFNWSVPVIIIILSAMGKFTYRLEDDPTTVTTAYRETYKEHEIADNT